ncbi:MAG TPA: integration host factor subunit alpha [Myxococcota bacterium]|jgi:integration host factor subunit alpha|nr:integration host factor subunit alpha [Myxococcota bacterium]
MTKADIVEGVYERLGGYSKKEAAAIVETILDVMKDALVAGDKVKISSFGSFTVRAKRHRMGRNPKTGKPLQISARKVLTFKPSQVLRSVLNS